MIELFKETEMRNSGVIYNSTFEQIKQLYEVDPEKAGELAISAIELVLTGEVSSDDMMVSMLLTPIKKINETNQARYDSRVENTKQKKITEQKLDKIATLLNSGVKQKEIAEQLNLSQQMVSYRIGVIRSNYPELLAKDFTKDTKEFYKNTKDEFFVKTQGETESVETKPVVDFRF